MKEEDIQLLKKQGWVGVGGNFFKTPVRWDFKAEYPFEYAVRVAREYEREYGNGHKRRR